MDLVAQTQKLIPDLSTDTSIVYILRLKSGSLYIGCTTDYPSRFKEHQAGTAGRTTTIDPAVSVEYIEYHVDFKSARQRESQLKRWSRAKKEALIARDIQQLKNLSKSND